MLVVNGTDLSAHGVVGRLRELPRFGGERSVIADIPGSAFPRRMGAAIVADRVGFDGTIIGTSHADLHAKIDAITALLNGPVGVPLYIRPSDITDREWPAVFQQGGRASAVAPQWLSRAAEFAWEFAVPGPARATAETVVAAMNQNQSLIAGATGLGTAPTPLKITVANGATDTITRVIVRIRKENSSSGPISKTLQWDGVVALSQSLVIDAETFSVTNNGANAIGGLTTASMFPTVDPREGENYLQVVITGGTGATRELRYRKRWF